MLKFPFHLFFIYSFQATIATKNNTRYFIWGGGGAAKVGPNLTGCLSLEAGSLWMQVHQEKDRYASVVQTEL